MATPPKELEGLIDEVRVLHNALVRWNEELHERESVSVAMRAVLEFLYRNGPTTVPAIARSRRVSRQFIQTLANGLLDQELLESVENPAHRRSTLLQLTRSGERTIARMRRREAAALEDLDLGRSETELRRATTTLRSIRESLEH